MEGIIFSDILINNKEVFINIFKQHYEKDQTNIDNAINNLSVALESFSAKALNTEENANKFRKAWLEFQRVVLLNQQPLQLIVVYRGSGGKDSEFSGILNQSQAEVAKGIDSGGKAVSDSIAAFKGSKVEEFLRSHSDEFITQLYERVGETDASNIWSYHKDTIPKAFSGNLSESKWQDVYYSNYYTGQGLGQAYDAFMNHVANYNTEVYNYLISSGKVEPENLDIATGKRKSVYNEEGGTGPSGNFPQLLKDSTNRVGWYTGGDIIIINKETMAVVYNIQLKTTTRNKQSVFLERVQSIRNFIATFKNSTVEKKAEQLYSFLLTSASNHSDFQNIPQKEINNLIKDTLTSKGLNFSIS